jgi:hypothetical protein
MSFPSSSAARKTSQWSYVGIGYRELYGSITSTALTLIPTSTTTASGGFSSLVQGHDLLVAMLWSDVGSKSAGAYNNASGWKYFDSYNDGVHQMDLVYHVAGGAAGSTTTDGTYTFNASPSTGYVVCQNFRNARQIEGFVRVLYSGVSASSGTMGTSGGPYHNWQNGDNPKWAMTISGVPFTAFTQTGGTQDRPKVGGLAYNGAYYNYSFGREAFVGFGNTTGKSWSWTAGSSSSVSGYSYVLVVS